MGLGYRRSVRCRSGFGAGLKQVAAAAGVPEKRSIVPDKFLFKRQQAGQAYPITSIQEGKTEHLSRQLLNHCFQSAYTIIVDIDVRWIWLFSSQSHALIDDLIPNHVRT